MRTRLRFLVLAATTLLLALTSGGAGAQGLSGAMSNLAVDSDAPIRIEADSLEIDEPKSTATFTGRVRASQEDMTLTSGRLIVNYRGGRNGQNAQLRTIDARGSVEMRVRDQTAKGEWAHYDLTEEVLTLTGKVVLSQGENVIRGEKIVVDLKTGKARMVASAEDNPGGRVRGLFMPNRRQ
jgi:lipopolysaccharide export system protein LptA